MRLLSLVHDAREREINNELNSAPPDTIMIQSEHKENYHLIKLRDAMRLLIVIFLFFFTSFWFFDVFFWFQFILRLQDLYMRTMKVRCTTQSWASLWQICATSHQLGRNGNGCECDNKNIIQLVTNYGHREGTDEN